MKSKAVACVLRCLLWLVAGVAGTLALLWCVASAYFLIAGRDIAPPDLSAYQLLHPKLQPAEDAYTYMKEYARGVKTNLNWNVAQAYIRGTANRRDCEGIVKDILSAESNAFRCAKGIIASRGISTPSVKERSAFIFNVCLCQRMVQCYRLKAVYEIENGSLSAGRSTLIEMFRLGNRMVELDDSMARLIGRSVRLSALDQMGKPMFAPDGDVAWLTELQKMSEDLSVGDVERARRSAVQTVGWSAADYWGDGFMELVSLWPDLKIIWAFKLNWIPGYVKFAVQQNRTLAAMKDEAERFLSKIGAPYDVEYARESKFGHSAIPAPTEPVNPLSRNWLGRKWVKNHGFGGMYSMLFRMRFAARSMETVFACRRFRAKHGCYPERLDELVPEFIAAVPLDPFDGKPLRYNNERHYVWTVGEELAFNGDVDFTSDGKPMWTSTRRRDYKCVRFLSSEGVSDADAGRPVAYYVPGWLRTGRRSDAPTWTSFTNTFSDARCESFSCWNGNEKWRKSLKNADSQWAMLSREIERMPESVRTNVTLVGHSLGARIVVRTLANLAGKGMKVRQGILLGAAIRNDDPDLQRIGGASVRPVLNLRNPNDVTLKYIYRVAGGEKGPALGVAGCSATNVVDRVVPGDITSETEIAAAWGKVDLLKRIASHHALFYLSALRKGSESPNQ